MGEKISFIIPVHNMQEKLVKCIESIVHQTYRNLDIILVDDHSTDQSGKICDLYSQNDKRIQAIHLIDSELSNNVSANGGGNLGNLDDMEKVSYVAYMGGGGVSCARNIGIMYAKGSIITFVDNDDYIELNFAETICNNMAITTDMMFFSRIREKENGKKLSEIRYNDLSITNENIGQYLRNINLSFLHGVVFRKALILDNGILFREDFSRGEDSLFIKQCILHINRSIQCSSQIMYHYVTRIRFALSTQYCNNIEDVYSQIYESLTALSIRFQGYELTQTKEKMVSIMSIQNLYSNGCTLDKKERIEKISNLMANPKIKHDIVYSQTNGIFDNIRRLIFFIGSPNLMDFVYSVAKRVRDIYRKI